MAFPADSPSFAPETWTCPATVLVADEDVLIRALLARELRERGYAVLEAASAEEALAILGTGISIDLLISHVWMPGPIDGTDLVGVVRGEQPAVKILVSSSDIPESTLDGCVDGFLPKPCDFDALAAQIKRLIG
jgi:two-component system cell cycle sensor histidine kinase/response regulator CckA